MFGLVMFVFGAAVGSTKPTTTTSASSTTGTMAPEPSFTATELEYLRRLGTSNVIAEAGGRQSVLRVGYDACSMLNADANNPQAAVQAVAAQSPLDESEGRAVVETAADTLCPVASAGSLSAGGAKVAPAAPAPVAAAPVAPPPAPAAPSGPVSSVPEGTYEVGTGEGQVAPGKYRSSGPPSGGMCYYARLSSDQTSDIIANDVKEGPMLMTVRASDKYVEIRGCTFTKA